ncbi:MAG: LiaI-LiaF-like domain-containing protein, partial [Sphingobacterium sp.]
MNNKIATGIWLVFIGGLILLYNFKIINFNFYAALQMWPIILVSIGISLLLQNRRNAIPIIVIANILLCGLILQRGLTSKENILGNLQVKHKTESSQEFQKVVSHAYRNQMKNAHLAINGGASKLTLLAAQDSNNLIYSKTNHKNSSLLLKTKGEENVKLDLTTNTKNNNNGETTQIELNTNPVWDLEFNLGVAQIEGDLRKFKLKGLEINSGASTLSLHLPNPEQGKSKIEVNTAASKILLYIPKNAA